MDQCVNKTIVLNHSVGWINGHFQCCLTNCFGTLSLVRKYFDNDCSARRCQTGQQVRKYSDFWMLSWIKTDWAGKNVWLFVWKAQQQWPAEKVELLSIWRLLLLTVCCTGKHSSLKILNQSFTLFWTQPWLQLILWIPVHCSRVCLDNFAGIWMLDMTHCSNTVKCNGSLVEKFYSREFTRKGKPLHDFLLTQSVTLHIQHIE